MARQRRSAAVRLTATRLYDRKAPFQRVPPCWPQINGESTLNRPDTSEPDLNIELDPTTGASTRSAAVQTLLTGRRSQPALARDLARLRIFTLVRRNDDLMRAPLAAYFTCWWRSNRCRRRRPTSGQPKHSTSRHRP